MITTLIVGGIVILISVGLLALMFMRSNQVNLTAKTDDKPEWMRSIPPQETTEATNSVEQAEKEEKADPKKRRKMGLPGTT